jgi:integrase
VPISDRLRPVIERAVRETESDHVLGWSGAIKRAFGTACRVAARRLSEAGHHESARKLATQVTPHVLRHTYATMALRHGVTLWDVAGVLGDTVETVRAVYGHHSPEHLRRAVNYRENKELVSGPVLLPAMVENEN